MPSLFKRLWRTEQFLNDLELLSPAVGKNLLDALRVLDGQTNDPVLHIYEMKDLPFETWPEEVPLAYRSSPVYGADVPDTDIAVSYLPTPIGIIFLLTCGKRS